MTRFDLFWQSKAVKASTGLPTEQRYHKKGRKNREATNGDVLNGAKIPEEREKKQRSHQRRRFERYHTTIISRVLPNLQSPSRGRRAGSGVRDPLRRLDSSGRAVAETSSRERGPVQEERGGRHLTHCCESTRDLLDYCRRVYIVYTLLIPKYTIYTLA